MYGKLEKPYKKIKEIKRKKNKRKRGRGKKRKEEGASRKRNELGKNWFHPGTLDAGWRGEHKSALC